MDPDYSISLGKIDFPCLVIRPTHEILFLSLNAKKILGLKNDQVYRHLAEVNRSPQFLEFFEQLSFLDHNRTIEISIPDGVDFNRIIRFDSYPLKPDLAFIVLTDVTTQKHLEVVRTEFIQNVSHEIRTPLTSIQGYLSTIKTDLQSKLYDDLAQHIAIIEKNATRLSRLVDDLLDLSALESGSELHLELISLEKLTHQFVLENNDLLKSKKQTLITNIHAKHILGDPLRLNQVLSNLVENASKYCPEGSSIELRWDTRPGDPKTVELRVIDNGPGIDPKYVTRIFERFFRADRSRTPGKGGTGLGLAIVKHIVQRHGGEVFAQSTLGQGTTIICTFRT